MNVEAPPPGELAEHELTGGDALEALHQALQAITAKPRAKATLCDITSQRVGRWIVLTFRYRKQPENEVTVRITKAWAEVLRNRLSGVLDR